MSKRITIRDKDGKIIGIQEVEEEGDFGYASTNDLTKGIVFILLILFAYFFSDSSDNGGKGGYSPQESKKQLNQSSEAIKSRNYNDGNTEDRTELNMHDKDDQVFWPDKNTINEEKDNSSTTLQENLNLHQNSEYIFFGKKIIKPSSSQDGPEIEALSYFKNSMARDMGFVYVEIRTNLHSNYGSITNGSSKASIIYTNQYDCQLMRVKTISVKAYDNFNGTGNEVEPPKVQDSWGPIIDYVNVVKQKICVS